MKIDPERRSPALRSPNIIQGVHNIKVSIIGQGNVGSALQKGAENAGYEVQTAGPNLEEVRAVPQEFIPRLVTLWQQGHFPADHLAKKYRLEDINKAFEDSASGATVKPVIVF